jgi:hypothetical protein
MTVRAISAVLVTLWLAACAKDDLEGVAQPTNVPLECTDDAGCAGTVQGRICDDALGEWVTGALVSITVGPRAYATNTSASGMFSLHDVPAGEHTVVVERGAFSAEYPVTVKAERISFVGSASCGTDYGWPFEHEVGEMCAVVPAESEKVLDLMFLVDTTGSMGSVIGSLQDQMVGMMNQIAAITVNSRFAVSHYEDFNDPSYGSYSSDRAYHLKQAMTDNTAAVRTAIMALTDAYGMPIGSGGDTPESSIEALYQAATGEGFTSQGIPASNAGWRPGAFKVIVLVTDADFRDPDDGDWAPSGAHGEAATIIALKGRGIRVVGIGARYGYPYPEFEQRPIALATGAISPEGVDGNGDGDFTDDGEIVPGGPLVFVTNSYGDPIGLGSDDMGEAIVVGIENVVSVTNVTVRLEGDDAELLTVVSSPESYEDVAPGDEVCFDITLEGEIEEEQDAEELSVEVQIVADGYTVLASDTVTFTPEPPSPGYD